MTSAGDRAFSRGSSGGPLFPSEARIWAAAKPNFIYEQYCSTSQALITGLLEAVRRSVLPESTLEIVRIAYNH